MASLFRDIGYPTGNCPDGMFYFRTIPGVLEPLLERYEDSFESMAIKAVELWRQEKAADLKTES